MSRTTITLDGQSWLFDEEAITVKEGIALKYATGMTVLDMLEGVQKMDGQALQSLVWFCRMKAGETVRPEDIDFPMMALRIEQEPDPTQEGAAPSGTAATD